jgi:hypothetical protein
VNCRGFSNSKTLAGTTTLRDAAKDFALIAEVFIEIYAIKAPVRLFT